MLTVFAALVPVFLLIVLGYVLRRILLPQDAHWMGLEQLVYYVLFPALLIETLGRANLASVPVGGVGGALLLSVLLMSGLCLAIRPFLARTMNVDGPAFTSVFQGTVRWQTFVALSVANTLFGDRGLALASVAMVAMIPMINVLSVSVLAHFASPQRMSWASTLMAIARNPIIWGCVIGLAINEAVLALSRLDVDYELLIVDDGSSDRTAEIVRALADTDERVRLATMCWWVMRARTGSRVARAMIGSLVERGTTRSLVARATMSSRAALETTFSWAELAMINTMEEKGSMSCRTATWTNRS